MSAPHVIHAPRSRARRIGGAMIAAAGAALVLGSGPAANAQTSVSFNLAHTDGATNIHAVQFAPAFDGNLTVSKTVFTTAYATTLTSGVGAAAKSVNLNTYCVDFANSLSGGSPYSYGVSLLSPSAYNLGPTPSFNFGSGTASRGDALAYLYANHAANADAAKSAALQLALWKTAYDFNGGDASLLSFTSGNFRVSGEINAAVKTNADAILASLNQWDGKAVAGVAYYSTSGAAGSQALIGADGGNPTVPVTGTPAAIPEPGSLALLAAPALGLIGRGIARRRRAAAARA